jgi:hypothetical protein
VVDHTCTDLRQVPQSAIEQAKASLHIAYGHTSHGSQVTDGMTSLVYFANNGGLGLSLPTNIFAWNNGGSGGALDLHDYAMAGDVGYYPDWINETVVYLDNPANADVNVIIWSWCGEASGYTEQQMIDYYLAPMSQLELDYPLVTFVYMTGHLDGTGQTGNLNLRNQQIRDYCIANNKTLYDFADIESYDPDGLVHYMPLMCTDNCDYDSDGDGSRDKNWALDWQNSHTEGIDWYSCSATHTQSLNGNRKAYAAWWLWAELGGWNPTPCAEAPSNLQVSYDTVTWQVTLTWTDNSSSPQEDLFIIQRQVDGGSWNNNYATVTQNTTIFTETLSTDGTYRYRVAAYMADNGQGSPCTSLPSNIVTAVGNTAPPATPSGLDSTLVSDDDIQLTWTDNSDNEQVFVLERSVDGGGFTVLDDAIAQNATAYLDEDVAVPHMYQYRLLARNSYGDSGYTISTTIEVSLLVPAAPTDLQCSLSGGNDIQLTWTDNSNNEQVFVLERSTDGGVFTVLSDTIAADTEAYADQGVASQHTYGYRIMARNASGDSGYSNTATQNVPYATYTLDLQSTTDIDDSFLSALNPTSNYGSDAWAPSNLDNNMRYIAKYNFPSSLDDKRILSADLNIYWWDQSGPWQPGLYMQLYQLTQNWDELSVTWNNAFTGTPLDPVLQFDGVDDYIEINDSRPYTTYTLSAWINPQSIGTQNVISLTDAGGISSSHQLRINASGQFEHYLYDYLSMRTVTGTTTVVPGTWYHVTGVATQNGYMRLYVNGIEEGTAVAIILPWFGSTRWRIGHSTSPEAGNHPYFNGFIKNVRLWDRALTPQEILTSVNGDPGGIGPVGDWKLNEGTGTTANDSSGNDHDGIIYSATWDIIDTGIPWTTPGGEYSNLVGQAEIGSVDHAYYLPADVTDIVRRWIRGEVPNYGLIMINENAFTSNIKASEYNIRSYLSVTYTDACSCDLSADFNYDCKVDLVDFYQMAMNLGLEDEQYDIAPAGGDGAIDMLDLQEMASQWLCECM